MSDRKEWNGGRRFARFISGLLKAEAPDEAKLPHRSCRSYLADGARIDFRIDGGVLDGVEDVIRRCPQFKTPCFAEMKAIFLCLMDPARLWSFVNG